MSELLRPRDTFRASFAAAAIALMAAPPLHSTAQTRSDSRPLTLVETYTAPSSSSLSPIDDLPEAPEITPALRARPDPEIAPGYRATRPFGSLAIGLTVGSGGIGLDLVTPINSKLNLRASGSLFSYTTSFTVDTIPIDGTLHLASAALALDYFPRARSFHISPGITLYNNTTYNALIFIPGNQIITLNDQDYTSDPNDPIHGTAFLKFGNRVAPRLTVGWGNVIRHRTAGLTFPVDIGIEYIKPPTASFVLTGSSCQSPGDCGPIQNDPDTQQNILEQQGEIVDDLKPLRFFPILSIGVSYKFGH